MRLLLALILLWPPTLSLSTAETTRGGTVYATATAGAGAALALPVGITADLVTHQGDTWIWRLTVADDAPLSRVPARVGLTVGGVEVASAALRVWTEDVRGWRVFLPRIATPPA